MQSHHAFRVVSYNQLCFKNFIDVANTFKATLKITGAQRIMITNLKAEDVDKAWEMLGMAPAYSTSNRVRSVKTLPRAPRSVNALSKTA